MLTDGDPETTWESTADAPAKIYVVADLGDVQDVGSVEWLPGPGGIGGRLHVETTIDGVSWESVDDPIAGTAGKWQELAIERPARAVRLVITNPDGAQLIGGVAELRIQPSAEP